jgi:hypothetical protein
MRRAWDDDVEATELGACAIAFLLMAELTPYTVVQRSRRGTGFDYWLGIKDNSTRLPFQSSARLEVSGIRKAENESMIRTRVGQKIKQVESVDRSLPAYIAIVEFSRPMNVLVQR